MRMSFYGLVVCPRLVKDVKTALEKNGLLRKSTKIASPSYSLSFNEASQEFDLEYRVIPTLVEVDPDNAVSRQQSDFPFSCVSIPQELMPCLKHLLEAGEEIYAAPIGSNSPASDAKNQLTDLEKALSLAVEATETVDPQIHEKLSQLKINEFPKQFSLYYPLVLLPVQGVSRGHSWQDLVTILNPETASKTAHDTFFSAFTLAMHGTHVALDAPIPLKVNGTEDGHDNVLRSPSHLTPLYGDFGPKLPAFPDHIPGTADFSSALWVTCKQNGISQRWAPRYSMFSAGNVTEKARILHHSAVREAVALGHESGRECAAVDLFAGIGYFAFSYARAGVAKVLCWDLNPWSVEALRRGAQLNKWTASILEGPHPSSATHMSQEQLWKAVYEARFLIFCESNEHALHRLSHLRSRLPPIRHVNAGMLPTAVAAWRTAIEALDAGLGGWLHLHETVRESDIQGRAQRILRAVQEHLDSLKENATRPTARLEHIEKVKSVAPRTLHVVLDIYVPGWSMVLVD